MHDPQILAFEIKYPWRDYKPWPKGVKSWDSMNDRQKKGRDQYSMHGYRRTFIQIWHVDPEKDGSDDSCGWSRPKLGEELIDKVKKLADEECSGHGLFHPANLDEGHGEVYRSIREPMATVYECFSLIAWRLFRKGIGLKEIPDVLALASSGSDGFSDSVTGYLTKYDIGRSFIFMTRSYLRMQRRWYEHPRWHIHHWKIQIVPLTVFKRWAFSRCAKCHKRFQWDYSPIAGQWHSEGPRWFKGEKSIYHHECYARIRHET